MFAGSCKHPIANYKLQATMSPDAGATLDSWELELRQMMQLTKGIATWDTSVAYKYPRNQVK